MIELYLAEHCPYCVKVRKALESMHVAYVSKPVFLREQAGNSPYAQELIKRGGKAQVPYLVDPERNVEMYESDDIIAYVKEHYA